MPSRNDKGELYFKILYWGPTQGGKTETLEALYQIMKESQEKGIPVSALTKIAAPNGLTLFFDRGVIKVGKKTYLQVYTVAGQRRFKPLRKVIYEGADGVVFVMSNLKRYWPAAQESLLELKQNVEAHNQLLLEQIPMVIQINYFERGDPVFEDEILSFLKANNLYFDDPTMAKFNPKIYVVHNFDKNELIQPFVDVAERILSYWSKIES